jgi:hypothetical protein
MSERPQEDGGSAGRELEDDGKRTGTALESDAFPSCRV